MSRGPGAAERHVLECVDGLEYDRFGRLLGPTYAPLRPGEGLPLLYLAETYAHERGVTYTRSVVESVRRAIHNLERKELVSTFHWWAPTARPSKFGGHVGRKMLLVGTRESSDGLMPWEGLRPSRTSPSRWERRRYLRDVGRCLVCGKDLEEIDIDALEYGIPIGDTCYDCWCERNPHCCHICGKELKFGVTSRIPPADNWCWDCWGSTPEEYYGE